MACRSQFCLLIFFLLLGLSGYTQKMEQREGYYPDGKLRYRGYFVEGQPMGEMTHYYPDGKIKAVMKHAEDNVSDAVLYSKDGNFTMSGRYLDRKKNGMWAYKKGDSLIYKEEYKDDRLNGVSEKYYTAGGIAERKHWSNGVLTGEWCLFYDDGKVRMEAVFVNGKLNGTVKSYAYTGKLTAEGTYKNNRKEGLWRYYDESGKLKTEKTFVAGVPTDLEAEELEETREIDAVIQQEQRIPDPADFMDEPENYLRLIGD